MNCYICENMNVIGLEKVTPNYCLTMMFYYSNILYEAKDRTVWIITDVVQTKTDKLNKLNV